MLHYGFLSLLAGLFSASVASAIPWNATEYMFVFGDSYTSDGYNVSEGVNTPTPGITTSNGPNWVEFLTGTYNQTAVKVIGQNKAREIESNHLGMQTFNLAYGGATIDSALVPPYIPTVLSIVDQVSEFNKYPASKPAGAQWDSTDSLFAVWIGINDVGNTFDWTNITQSEFYGALMDRLFSQVNALYDAGARNFLFLTVPPTNRAPVFVGLGPQVAAQLETDIANYNAQLTQSVRDFKAKYTDLGSVTVFDTQPIFNTLLDQAETFGFVNATGYCVAYGPGYDGTYQAKGCAPVSSYFWLNWLHPMFTVHNILAMAISTTLAGYPATQLSM